MDLYGNNHRRQTCRLATIAAGLGGWSVVLMLHPEPVRALIFLGATLLLLLGLRAPQRRADDPDAELAAIVHDRIAATEELAGDRIAAVTGELAAIRQQLDRSA